MQTNKPMTIFEAGEILHVTIHTAIKGFFFLTLSGLQLLNISATSQEKKILSFLIHLDDTTKNLLLIFCISFLQTTQCLCFAVFFKKIPSARETSFCHVFLVRYQLSKKNTIPPSKPKMAQKCDFFFFLNLCPVQQYTDLCIFLVCLNHAACCLYKSLPI